MMTVDYRVEIHSRIQRCRGLKQVHAQLPNGQHVAAYLRLPLSAILSEVDMMEPAETYQSISASYIKKRAL